jgi:cytochrome c553
MKFRPTPAAVLGVLGLGLVTAAPVSTAFADGNAEKGKVLAYTCHGCHGVPNYNNAYPHYSVPKLGGQHAGYLISALKAYAAGERSHPTMHAQAASLSDQDRAEIAAFLEGSGVQPAKEVVGTPPPATQTCVACHGQDGAKTVSPDYPVLAGQQADYIVHALQDYKSGKRKNPVMGGIVAGVDAKDFPALADFFSRQGGLCTTDQLRDHGKCQKE